MAASRPPSRPPVILVADDQEWAVRSLESVLGPRGYALLFAGTGRQALELARSARPDAVILDFGLPDISGVEVCSQLHHDPRFATNVPIVITTAGGDSRAQRIGAYQCGAWEFCTQPLDLDVLLPKLEAYIRAKLAADRVEDESLVDQETGLYNMRGLARRAREIGADAQRRSAAIACIAFSSVVDPDGSAASGKEPENAVEGIAQICRTSARVSDAIGRVGSNEYAILAVATEERGATRIIERLRSNFDAFFVERDGRPQRVRVNATYVAVPNLAESQSDAVELLFQATEGLRRARTSGRVSGPRDAPSIRTE